MKPDELENTYKAARVSSRPCVVIGICTFQRNDLLLDLLTSIEAQTGSVAADVSLVIVDNNPVPSVPHARVNSATKFRCEIVHEPRAGLVHARNRLFEIADSIGADWLIGTDDDVVVAEDWLSQWIKGIDAVDGDILLGSINLSFSDGVSPFIPQRPFSMPQAGKAPRVLATGNYAVSKKVFSQTGGLGLRFHHDFNQIGGEDAEFFLRAKRQHGTPPYGWPHALIYEEQRGNRLTLRYHLNRTLCTQLNGFYIAALHRREGLLEKPAPLALMLTRRTIKSFGKSMIALSVGVLRLPFTPKGGQQTIGIGLEHLARAFAIAPYLLGTRYRRYGVAAPESTEHPSTS